MKVGLIARGEDRGLGIMTWEVYRNLQPDRTILVDMGALARGFRTHRSRFPDAQVADFSPGHLQEDQVRSWLRGLDVVYSAETFYDWRLVEWARAEGVRTVLHVMPEFYRHGREALPHPDAVWAPTTWMLDTLPPDTPVVPVPVATDRFQPRVRGEAGVFLHVAGHRAAADRAGTVTLLRALRFVTAPMEVLMVTQDVRLPQSTVKRCVTLRTATRQRGDYWATYDRGDVLVSPRRYGGLSLPHNEAAAAGLALVLPDVDPNPTTWPGRYVKARADGALDTPAGSVVVHTTDPAELARTLDHLATHPEVVADLSAASICWAAEHSWEALAGTYLTRLEEACGG